MRDTDYRRSLTRCANRYMEMIERDVSEHADLLSFLHEIVHCITGEPTSHHPDRCAPYPLPKLNRWVGYVQGVLIERGLTTVEAERDWTRPLFRPLDFAEQIPSFCGWSWSEDDTMRLRNALASKEDDRAAMYAIAAEAIRIWCERDMPGLGEPRCPKDL